MTFLLAGGPEGDVFVERGAELAGLADVLARSRQGEPWLVTIEGESGVGKTALARRSLAPLSGLITLWARADPSEADFEYGLIGQLLRGVGRQVLARYPLLAGDVARSSPFAIGVQLLGIIGELQKAGPLALVIDDVQWADRRLYLRTVLSDHEGLERLDREAAVVLASLAAAIGDQLAALPAPTRALLEMMATVNGPVPLALLGEAASVAEPTTAIEPAVHAGLADLSPDEPTRPVAIRHALQRDAIYAGMTAGRRRELHARAVNIVDEASGWAHRVASLDRPDEGLAAELERLANGEAATGRLALAATHLRWASDISPARADRERRLLTAALHLMLAEEARDMALREAVEAAAPSPLRSCVLGTMAFSSGRLAEAELRFREALAQARADPGRRPSSTTWATSTPSSASEGAGNCAGSSATPVASHPPEPASRAWLL